MDFLGETFRIITDMSPHCVHKNPYKPPPVSALVRTLWHLNFDNGKGKQASTRYLMEHFMEVK